MAEQTSCAAVDIGQDVAGREAGGPREEEEVYVAHALAVGGDIDALGPHDALDRADGRREHRAQAAASAGVSAAMDSTCRRAFTISSPGSVQAPVWWATSHQASR